MTHGRHATRAHTGLATLSVLIACFFFSTGATGRALLNFVGTSTDVAAWRVFVGGIVIVAFASRNNGLEQIRRLVRMPIMWLMGLSTLLYQLAFFYGAQRIGIAVGTLVAQAVAPLTAVLLGWAVNRLRPTTVWVVCTAIALAGLSLITGSQGTADPLGLIAVSASRALYAMNTVFGSRLVRTQGVTGSHIMGASFGIGAILAAGLVIRSGDWVATREGLALITWNGVFATGMAYLLFGVGITHLHGPTVSTLALFEPVSATVQGVILLGEPMAQRGWIGCGVIVLALAGLAVGQRSRA